MTAPDSVRPVKNVPLFIIPVLAFALAIQIMLQVSNPVNPAVKPLPAAISVEKITLISLADLNAASRMLMLWLQAFDNQPGVSIPFKQLDYPRVIDWLDVILKLDHRTLYPLLAASRIYSEVPDMYKKKLMLDFVYEKFLEEPDNRWPALAHAVFVAKHQLKDLPLALKYANALATLVTRKDVPFWVKQMNIYVLEDMNEIESAKVLLGGLIESGEIKDEHELSFLRNRLEQLEQKSANSGH